MGAAPVLSSLASASVWEGQAVGVQRSVSFSAMEPPTTKPEILILKCPPLCSNQATRPERSHKTSESSSPTGERFQRPAHSLQTEG